jgi:hypothetical protein
MTGDSPTPASSRRRRWGCLAFAVVWLCVAAISIVAGLLAVRGDIVISQGELRQTRLWLVTEVEQGNRGLGLSTMRFVSGGENESAACVETRVRFFLWQSQGGAHATRYCECYRREGGAWRVTGPCGE